MNCPQCCGAEQMFGRGLAEHDLHNYQAHGPGKTTRMLIEALESSGIEGLTLLDTGGGVGAIQHELLKAGVNRATAVDASSAYLQADRRESERQGHTARITYHHGDFVELAPQLPQADIVTLDKAICCYPDMRALVSLSAARAGKLYGVVFPRDTWWMKAGSRLVNFLLGLRRNAFRMFVHSTAEVEVVIHANGLEQRYYRRTFLWQVRVYAR
jgi:2-polyprenyl-3-methyl-5-hydroxy-6-metoxy-1,4-benzoquinol methylase